MPRVLGAPFGPLALALAMAGCGGASDAGSAPVDVGDAEADAGGQVEAGVEGGDSAADAADARADAPVFDCEPGADRTYLAGAHPTLDRYCVVGLVDGEVAYPDGVEPYDLATPLFSDYAVKRRAVFVPRGESATYDPNDAFGFPVGSILVKTFGFPDDARKAKPVMRWVETRLLVRAADGWHAYAYLWNEAQTSAKYAPGGRSLSVSWIDERGQARTHGYLQPAQTQCLQCHQSTGVLEPIGPKARNLNHDFAYATGAENQLAHWSRRGLLAGAPADPATAPRLAAWNDPTSFGVAERARAYLEVNCAHCHRATGAASTSGLFLEASEADPLRFGVCKEPLSAGGQMGSRTWDVVPGTPDASILLYRMTSNDPGIAMPQIGRDVVDDEGVALVRAWIEALPSAPCNAP